MKDNKVLVIGGSGFLGSHIADALCDSGYEVIIYDCKPSPYLRPEQKMVVGDIMDHDTLRKGMQGCSYVYHLAGIADIGEAATNPEKTIEINIIGSIRILEACVTENIKRILFASTVYVYSDQGSFYRISKQAVESILENYHENFNLQYTILRFGSLYGPRAQEWNGLKKFITQAIKEQKIEFIGTGDEKREYIHVSDAATLSVEVLANEYANQCLNLTGSQVLSMKELMNMINEVMGGKIEICIRSDLKASNHYGFTPYRFTPKSARKIVPKLFYDIGQGILDLIEESYSENR